MNITKIINLGVVSPSSKLAVKFVVLDEGILLFGLCHYHKDLIIAYLEDKNCPRIIGAGTLPYALSQAPVTMIEKWGNWLSTGYGVTTPEEDRDMLREKLLAYEVDINFLWSSSSNTM